MQVNKIGQRVRACVCVLEREWDVFKIVLRSELYFKSERCFLIFFLFIYFSCPTGAKPTGRDTRETKMEKEREKERER